MQSRRSTQISSNVRTGLSTTPTPQIAKTNTTGRRAAGYSQIKGRALFIKQISAAAKDLKQYQINFASRAKEPQIKRAIQIKVDALKRIQQRLVNLLARYKF